MTLDYFYGQAGELFSFYRIPKALFQESQFQSLSTDAKTLYGILLDRMSLSVKNEWFDKKGRVFIIFTIEDVKRTLRCADNKATRLLRELEEFGLIERKRRGQGKPCLVYVKNFSAESSKENVKNRDNDDSCGSKIACQDPVKSRGIKKKENKTEMNNTNPIFSDGSEKMKNRELLEEYFSHSLEIDLLFRLYPDDEDGRKEKCHSSRGHCKGCVYPCQQSSEARATERSYHSMNELKPRIHENGIDYILVGDYYVPDLKLPEEKRPIGHWGRLHKAYLQNYRPAVYNELVLSCRLHSVLADLNEQANDRFSLIMEQMARAEGVTEQMKADNQMLWVQSMNSIRNRAEEIIKHEMIYCHYSGGGD